MVQLESKNRIAMRKLILLTFACFIILSNLGCSFNQTFENKQSEIDERVLNSLMKNENSLMLLLEDIVSDDIPKTKNDIEKHYNSYKEKFIALGFKSLSRIPWLYLNKVNLNAIAKLKRIGIDIRELDSHNFAGRHGLDLKSTIMLKQVILSGTIADSLLYLCPDSTFHEYYVIKVDSVLKGKEFYNSLPDEIKIFTRTAEMYKDSILVYNNVPNRKFKLGKSYVFLLEKLKGYGYYRERMLDYSKRNLIDEYNYMKILSEPTSFRISSLENIEMFDDICKIIEDIDKVNDSRNFYNNSWDK